METEKQTETTDNAEAPFEHFAIVELMGRHIIAGRVSEVTIAGKGFLRVDVPAVGEVAAFTKFFATTAVYAITPTTEEIAISAANRMRVRPVDIYVVPDPSRQLAQRDRFDDDYDSDNY